ncbi:MAG TPA: acyl-CoA dehydrogenase [Egibacteraceae bacterium]|nr:acyl-CoA dehydrogenase [Egibacteraceae bacterium]
MDATPVSAAKMRHYLDGRWGWAREQTREFLRQPLFQPVHGLAVEDYRERVYAQLQALASGPWVRVGFPPEYGGRSDVGAFLTAFETLAHGDLSLLVKAGVHWGLFGGAVLHLGTTRHHEAYLRKVISAELPGCFAMTELGHGSDVQAIRTTATYDPAAGEFVIHTPEESARKEYIGNAARHGRMAAVFAQLCTLGQCHGVHAFLVPIRGADGSPAPGVRIGDSGHKMGLNGVDNGRLWFDQVRVPRESLLDRYGQVAPDGTYTSPIADETKRFFTMLGTLVQGRVSIAGAGVSAAKSALTIAVRYGDERRQFSPPGSDREIVLLDYTAHQRRLLPLLARTYALHFAQEALVARFHEVFTSLDADGERRERPRRELESLAAGLKALSTSHATRTVQECREACGGAGYLSENRLGELKADTDVFTTFEGDNTVLLQLVAKGLLTGYRDEFGSLDMLGMVRFVADQAVETVLERTGARGLVQTIADVVNRDDDGDLRDPAWHLELYRWREEHVLGGLARRLRKGIDSGCDAFGVFNECQDHVLLAARAHVERVVVECFHGAVGRCGDPELRAVLASLSELHALAGIEAERGWFLEHGRISNARAKGVIAAVTQLCGHLRPHARALVDAFGIPDEAIAAPIALGGAVPAAPVIAAAPAESPVPGRALTS